MHCLRQLTLYFPRYVVTLYCRREQWHCDVELAAIFALANRFLAYRTKDRIYTKKIYVFKP